MVPNGVLNGSRKVTSHCKGEADIFFIPKMGLKTEWVYSLVWRLREEREQGDLAPK